MENPCIAPSKNTAKPTHPIAETRNASKEPQGIEFMHIEDIFNASSDVRDHISSSRASEIAVISWTMIIPLFSTTSTRVDEKKRCIYSKPTNHNTNFFRAQNIKI